MRLRVASLLLVMGFSVPAQALMEQSSHVLNIGMGGGVPLMDIDLAPVGGGRERFGSSGVAGGAQYIYQATPAIGLGLDIAGVRFADREHLLPQSVAASGGSLLTVEGLARFLLLPEKRLSPFILGGAGMNHFNANLEARPAAGFVWSDTRTSEIRRIIDKTSLGYALSLGGGLEGRIGETGLLGIEGRWSYASIDRNTYGTKAALATTLFARLGWVFGGR